MKFYRSEPATPWVAHIVGGLPDWVRAERFGHAVWQLLGLALLLVLGFSLMFLIYWLGRTWARKFRDQDNIWRYLFTLVFPISAMLVPFFMKRMIKSDLVLGGELLKVTDFLLGVLVLFTVLRLLWAVGNRLLAFAVSHPKMEENQMDVQFIRLIGRVLTVLIVVVVFLEGGGRLGIPLSSLVAGAGIGAGS